MDALAGLLDGPRARGAFVLLSSMEPPWSLRVQDEAPLTVVTALRGEAWLAPDGGDPVVLRRGDVAVVRGPVPYLVADDPARPPQAVIHPGQVCTAPDGTASTAMGPRGTRAWGNAADGSTLLVTGTYQLHSEVSRRLLAALPALVHVPAGGWDETLLAYLADEVGKDAPGQEAVLDRVLDLLLIAALRTWMARPEGQAPGWYRAQSDPVVGPAVRLLHEHPDRAWTLASLAVAVGVSRSGLARRFTALVGEPPMAFLTAWRMTLAADLLREPGATVDAVARRVGYGSGFALSTAFRRERGVTPQQHRKGEFDR
jgi:AraC-like DNA-binding protein